MWEREREMKRKLNTFVLVCYIARIPKVVRERERERERRKEKTPGSVALNGQNACSSLTPDAESRWCIQPTDIEMIVTGQV